MFHLFIVVKKNLKLFWS